MTPHTPAPWSPTLATLVIDLDGNVICRVDPDRPEHEANRALIAAAPEMREALEAYQAAWSALFDHCLSNGVFNHRGYSLDCTALNAAKFLADAALAKSNPDTE